MLAAKLIERLEQFQGVGDLVSGLGVRAKDEANGDTLLEHDSEILMGVGGFAGIIGQLPHVIGWGVVWVLEDASLVGAVGQAITKLAMTVPGVTRA